jgi:hypothetical protein
MQVGGSDVTCLYLLTVQKCVRDGACVSISSTATAQKMFGFPRHWLTTFILWDVTSCSLVEMYRYFIVMNYLHPQVSKSKQAKSASFAFSSTLKMEAICSLEIFAHLYQRS